MAALGDEAVASMDIAKKNAGLAPAFLCPAIAKVAARRTSNYVCNLIASPASAAWRCIVMTPMKSLLAGLLVLGMAGCATVAKPPVKAPNEGSTSYRMVDDGHMAHYPLALGDVAVGGKPFQRVLPTYPPALLAACPPVVDVEVQVIVGTTGKASEVRHYPIADAPATPIPSQFFDAARAAVMQWQFVPLQISHWAADAEGNTHEVDSDTKPFSLVYAFRFECHAGMATVSSAPPRG